MEIAKETKDKFSTVLINYNVGIVFFHRIFLLRQYQGNIASVTGDRFTSGRPGYCIKQLHPPPTVQQ